MADRKTSQMVSPDGALVEVYEDQRPMLLAAGYADPTAKTLADAESQKSLIEAQRGPAGSAAAFARGGLESLTFGGSTLLERQLLGTTPAEIEANAAAHPVAHAAGSIAGVVAPMILSGGSSAAAKGAISGAVSGAAKFSAPSLINAAGGIAERAVTRGLSKAGEAGIAEILSGGAQSFAQASPVVTGIARGVARGVTEGALYGAGEINHESALGHAPADLGEFAGRIGVAGVVGGALGGTLSGAGAAYTKMAPKIADAAGALQAEAYASTMGITADEAKAVLKKAADYGWTSGPLTSPERILKKAAEGANKAETELERVLAVDAATSGGSQPIHPAVIADFGDNLIAGLTDAKEPSAKQVEALFAPYRTPVSPIRTGQDLIETNAGGVAKRADALLNEIKPSPVVQQPVPVEEFWNLRKQVLRAISETDSPFAPAWTETVKQDFDQALGERILGGNTSTAWQRYLRIRDASEEVQKMASAAVVSQQTARFGLEGGVNGAVLAAIWSGGNPAAIAAGAIAGVKKEFGVQAAGALAGGIRKLVVGIPKGVLESLAAGENTALSVTPSTEAASYFDQLASVRSQIQEMVRGAASRGLLDEAAKTAAMGTRKESDSGALGGETNAARNQAVTNASNAIKTLDLAAKYGDDLLPRIASAARDFVEGPGPAAIRSALTGVSAQTATEVLQRVQEAGHDPLKIADQITDALEPVGHLPTVSAVAAETMASGVGYLRENAPEGAPAPFGSTEPGPVSQSALTAYARRVQGVLDPEEALRNPTPESLDAIRTVYPKIFARWAAEIVSQVADLVASGKKPRYQDLQRISNALGTPIVPSQSQQMLALTPIDIGREIPQGMRGLPARTSFSQPIRTPVQSVQSRNG